MMVELNRAIFFDDDDDDDDDDGLLLFQIEQKAYGYQTLDQLYVSGTTEKLEINLLHIIIISLYDRDYMTRKRERVQ